MTTGAPRRGWRTAAAWTWNVLLVVLVVAAGRLIFPKVEAQFELGWSWTFIKPALDGIAIWLVIAAACASLATWTWRRVPGWVRVATAAIIVLSLAASVGIMLEERTPGLPLRWKRLAFFAWMLVIGTPIVLAGCGYPGLVRRFVRRGHDDG